MEIKESSFVFANFEDIKDKYEVFIVDMDGTLWNGNSRIEGTAECTYELMKNPKNLVLFYTNGGYCTLESHFQGL